ncbi:MAG TPA: hypothetical protein VD902_19275 [Symbiobacteriaceae bacterium]|nr:hypothetical protein [Symbiobacteriaceae bacterium]
MDEPDRMEVRLLAETIVITPDQRAQLVKRTLDTVREAVNTALIMNGHDLQGQGFTDDQIISLHCEVQAALPEYFQALNAGESEHHIPDTEGTYEDEEDSED